MGTESCCRVLSLCIELLWHVHCCASFVTGKPQGVAERRGGGTLACSSPLIIFILLWIGYLVNYHTCWGTVRNFWMAEGCVHFAFAGSVSSPSDLTSIVPEHVALWVFTLRLLWETYNRALFNLFYLWPCSLLKCLTWGICFVVTVFNNNKKIIYKIIEIYFASIVILTFHISQFLVIKCVFWKG